MRRIPALFVAGVTFLCFLPALEADFVSWDDDTNFTLNESYRGLGPAQLKWMFTTTQMGHYIPVTWMTLGLDYAIWGMDARGYHLTNLLLHVAGAVCFYFFLVALLRRAFADAGPSWETALHAAAAAGALLFAIHPLRVESVAWVTERRDVLSGLFLLLTLTAYLRMVETRRRRWLIVALACYALSLLSKSIGMTLPAVLLILDVYPLRRWRADPRRAILVEKIPFALLALAAAVAAIILQRRAGTTIPLSDLGLMDRLALAAYGLWFYVWKTVVPMNLSPLYLFETGMASARSLFVLLGSGAILAAIGLYMLRHRWPAGWVSASCYAVLLLPVVGLTHAGPQVAADRYSYLSCLPWAALVAGAIYAFCLRRREVRPLVSAVVTAAVLMLVLGVLTTRQTRVWRDSLTLWNHAVRVEPENYRAFLGRGDARREAGRLDEAKDDYTKVLTLYPRFAQGYLHRATVRLELGDAAGAAEDYSRAIEFGERKAGLFLNRGLARYEAGDLRGAVEDYTEAIRIDPGFAVAYYNRGNLMRRVQDFNRAIADYTEALRLDPGLLDAYQFRAEAHYFGRRDLEAAIRDLEEVLRAAPPDWPDRANVEAFLQTLKAGAPGPDQ